MSEYQKDTVVETINYSHILEYETLKDILLSFLQRIQKLENDSYSANDDIRPVTESDKDEDWSNASE